MNVYQMIESGAFDEPSGLWVQRNSWGNTVARVTSFDAFKGPAPYFGNPTVYVDLFYLRGVRFKKNEVLSCPGTQGYTLIPAPSWWADRSFTDAYAAASK
jgi:hypothetical protein